MDSLDELMIRQELRESAGTRLRSWAASTASEAAEYWERALERAQEDLVRATREIAPMEWYWLAFLFLIVVMGWYWLAIGAGQELRMW